MPNEYVLKFDGRVIRRPAEITMPGEVEIDLEQNILQTLGIVSKRHLKNLAVIPQGNVNGCVYNDAGDTFLHIRLTRLPIISAITTDTEGIVSPSFVPRGESVVTLEWTPPATMRLILAAKMSTSAAMPGTWVAFPIYIFAFYGERDCYQLPIGNLYDDCKLCTGLPDNHFRQDNMLGCFISALANVESSKWNNDLLNRSNDRTDNSRRMFRFKPTDTGFECLPAPANWPTLCQKIGTDTLTLIRHE